MEGSVHRQAEMWRCFVLHENDPVLSLSLHVFNLWENVKLKQVQINVSSNGALRKKERAYNTITEQPTANFKVARYPHPLTEHVQNLRSFATF
jgi:hypothetical protein